MRRPDPKAIFTSYAVAWTYLAGFVAVEAIRTLLPPAGRAAFVALGQHQRAQPGATIRSARWWSRRS